MKMEKKGEEGKRKGGEERQEQEKKKKKGIVVRGVCVRKQQLEEEVEEKKKEARRLGQGMPPSRLGHPKETRIERVGAAVALQEEEKRETWTHLSNCWHLPPASNEAPAVPVAPIFAALALLVPSREGERETVPVSLSLPNVHRAKGAQSETRGRDHEQ
jgi:hypothetical protein